MTQIWTLIMNDNLNVSNLIITYNENKKKVGRIIFGILLFFAIYAFSIPNTYRAEIFIVPPQDKYVQPLNYFATQIAKDSQLVLEQKLIYFEFMKNAQSRKFQRKFFYDNKLYDFFPGEDREEVFAEKFHDNLRFRLESKSVSRDIRQEDFLTVSYVHTDPELSAKWLNNFIKIVEKETSKNIVDGVNASINNYSRKIKSAIESKKQLAKQIKFDKITQLKEALIIAEKLNIVTPSNATLTSQTIFMDDGGSTGPTQLTEIPLYLFGTNALESQIKSLQDRVSDDPFIPNLRFLEEELNSTSLVKVGYGDVRVAEIDQFAMTPKKKFAPRRSLILILGLFFGVLFSFIYLLYIHYKKQNNF